LNKESGWQALAGTTDFGVISSSADGELAFALFADRVAAFVGAYFVALQGEVDALVFAGGIGEKGARLRGAVARQAACLGFAVDDAANERAGKKEDVVVDVSAAGAARRVLVCRTDEQWEMARECAEDADLWR
jgi:acetate kinase